MVANRPISSNYSTIPNNQNTSLQKTTSINQESKLFDVLLTYDEA